MKNYTHPRYLTDTTGYDISIITVVGTIRFVKNKVQPIKMSSDKIGADVTCLLTGWGSTEKLMAGPYPNDLQKLEVSTISYEDCKATPSYGFITENNLCTLSPKGEGACSGHSGGPLVDIEKNMLVGVVEAVNSGGCAIGQPDIFTRISTFYYWIERQTKKDTMMPNHTPIKIPGMQK